MAAVVLVGATGTAEAQEATSGSGEELMHPVDLDFEPLAGRWAMAVHGSLVAGAITDDREATPVGLAAGFELARAHEACELFRVGGRASLMVDPRGGTSLDRGDGTVESWFSLCLMGGFPLPSVTLENRSSLWVTPQLSARRRTLALPQSANDFAVRMSFVDLPLGDFDPAGDGQHLVVARVTMNVTHTRQYGAASPSTTPGALASDIDDHLETSAVVDTVAWFDADGRGVDVFAVEIAMYQPDGPAPVRADGTAAPTRSVSVMDFTPLRLTNLGRGALRWDAALGWASAAAYDADAPIDPETMAAIPRWQDDYLSGRLAFRLGGPRLTTGIELTRDAWPTLDDGVALEERVTVHSSGQRGRWSFAARAFAARTRVTDLPETMGAPAPTTTSPTGGADARLSLRLGRFATASLSAEVARSYYAVPGAQALEPAWGARAFASVGAAWSR